MCDQTPECPWLFRKPLLGRLKLGWVCTPGTVCFREETSEPPGRGSWRVPGVHTRPSVPHSKKEPVITFLGSCLAVANRYRLPCLETLATTRNDEIALVDIADDFDKTTEANSGLNRDFFDRIVVINTHYVDVGTT